MSNERNSAITDEQRMDYVERMRCYIFPSGYRGRDGIEVHIADPGGHYQEECTRQLGWGKTRREALDAAMTNNPLP